MSEEWRQVEGWPYDPAAPPCGVCGCPASEHQPAGVRACGNRGCPCGRYVALDEKALERDGQERLL